MISAPRNAWGVLALLVLTLVPWLRGCAPVVALDQAWSDRLQVLQTRHVEAVPLTLVSVDGLMTSGVLSARRDALMAVVTRLLGDGAAAVGLQLPAGETALLWPEAASLAGPSHVMLLWRQPVALPLVVPAEPWPDADGVVRHLYLTQQAPWEDKPQPQGVWTLLQLADMDPPWPGQKADPSVHRPAPPGWVLAEPVALSYADQPGQFPRLAHEDVLAGRHPSGAVRGRVVLVGATGAAAAWYPTPAGGVHQPMAGVEWTAQVAEALLRGGTLGAVSVPASLGLTLGLLAPWLLVLGQRGPRAPRQWLWASALVVGVALLLAVLLQLRFNLLWGPGPLVLAVLLGGAGWFIWHLSQLAGQRQTEAQPQEQQPRPDMLQQMSDAALSCDLDGQQVDTCNPAAVRLLGLASGADWQRLTLVQLLDDLLGTDGAKGWGLTAAQRLCQSALVAPPTHSQHECVDRHGRDLLIKVAPLFDTAHVHRGWLLTLIDISLFRARQRQRDDELNFLGHDLRAPQSAALAVLELGRQQAGETDVVGLADRVERHVRRGLALSDGFIQLLRAQDGQLRSDEVNLVNLVEEAVDDHWAGAHVKQVHLVCEDLPEEALVRADHEMLGRALGNLVGNAVKFSPAGTTVRCRLVREGGCWVIEVADQGPGIAHEEQDKLFRPFARASGARHVAGAGLGLPMVKAVVDRLQGRIEVRSQLGMGTTFRVVLPAVAAVEGLDREEVST